MQPLPSQILAAVEQARGGIDPKLPAWVIGELAAGCTPNDVVQRLVKSGRPVEVATLVVGLAIKGLTLAPASRQVAQTQAKHDYDPAHSIDHAIHCGETTVRTLMSVGRGGGMEMALYDNMVSDAEIELLKSAALPRLVRSAVLAPNFGSQDSDVRTSRGTYLQVGCHPLVSALEARISAVTGIPVSRGEGLQILHYGVSHEYEPHYDYFDPTNQKEHAMMARSGNRVGTMIMYLNDVEQGGATYFPKLDLAIHPKRGQAIWFSYLHDGLLDERSQHAGMPVLAGEKWIATKWFRERCFSNLSICNKPSGSKSTENAEQQQQNVEAQ